MKIQRALLLAGFLVGATAATALADGNMVIDTHGQMRIELDVPTDDNVDLTRPVTAGRIEIAKIRDLPPWGAVFSLNHMSLSFGDFEISRDPFGLHRFRAMGAHLRAAVSFAALEAPAGVFTFSIPKEAVTVYGGAMVEGALGGLHAGEEQPSEDVTGTMNLNTNTFQARVVIRKEGEFLGITVGGPLTITLFGTIIPPPPPPTPGDFRITCTPSINLQANTGTGTGTCTVHSENGFAHAVQLSCSGLPPQTSCQFDPPTVTPPPGGAVTSTLTVSAGYLASGTYEFQPYAYRGSVARMTTVQLIAPPGALTAAYDAMLQAPSCGTAIGRSCDSVNLTESVGSLGEPNYPNTIAQSCADQRFFRFGPQQFVHGIRVSTTNGMALARGEDVRIDATVWRLEEEAPGETLVDFFYASDASAPTWVLIGTLPSMYGDFGTLSVTYRLPAGGPQQAVRVQARSYTVGTAVPCRSNGDRDDLIFAVSAWPSM